MAPNTDSPRPAPKEDNNYSFCCVPHWRVAWSEAAATTSPGLESAFRRRGHLRYLVCGLIGLLR